MRDGGSILVYAPPPFFCLFLLAGSGPGDQAPAGGDAERPGQLKLPDGDQKVAFDGGAEGGGEPGLQAGPHG